MLVFELIDVLEEHSKNAEVVIMTKDGKILEVSDVLKVNISSRDRALLPTDLTKDQKSYAEKVVALEAL